MDVTDATSRTAALDKAEAQFGPVDILLNNAGIARDKPALDQSEADWDAVLNSNLKAPFMLATEVARRLVASGREGSIINIASVLGLGVTGNLASYSASKAGLIHLTRALAREWAGKGIRVNAIAPGYIATDINQEFFATPAGERLIRRIPQRRLGSEFRPGRRTPAARLPRVPLYDGQRPRRRWRLSAGLNHYGQSPRPGGEIDMEDGEIRAALERHWAASDANDFAAEHDIYHEDAVLHYPQSGERIRGRGNIQESRTVQPSRKRFTVQRIIGAGELWVSEFVLSYDGAPSYTVSIMEFTDGKVVRETQYFAAPFEPGPSRAHLVDLNEPPGHRGGAS